MRQIGILCAAALVALKENIGKLDTDHKNARLLADGLNGIKGFRVDPCSVETNIVLVRNVPHDPDESVGKLVEHFFLVNHPDHYLTHQIIGGIWADKLGGKVALGFGVVWWSIATVLTPIAAKLGLPWLLVMRAFMGIGEVFNFIYTHALVVDVCRFTHDEFVQALHNKTVNKKDGNANL